MHLEDAPRRGLEHRAGVSLPHQGLGHAGPRGLQVSLTGSAQTIPGRATGQFRSVPLMIEASFDYGRSPLRRNAGFTRRACYGPQVNKTEIFCAVLQFGGASGSGY